MLLRGYRRGAGRTHQQHVRIMHAHARQAARQEAARLRQPQHPRFRQPPAEPAQTPAQRSAHLRYSLERRNVPALRIHDVLSNRGLLPLGHGRYGNERALAAPATHGPLAAIEAVLHAVRSALTIKQVGLGDEGLGFRGAHATHPRPGRGGAAVASDAFAQGYQRQLNHLQHSTAGIPAAEALGPIGQITKNALADVNQSAVGFLPGLVDLATNPVGTGKKIAHQYGYTYGPLLHGDLGTFGRRVEQHPLGPALDVYGAATLGAGAVERGLLGTAAQNAIREAIPFERGVGVRGTAGGQVQPPGSPSAVTRAIEHRYDKWSQQHPHVPVIGGEARVARRVRFESERDRERLNALAVPFQVARRAAKLGLRPTVDHAYDVLHRYGPTHAVEYVNHEIEMRKARISGAHLADERAAAQAKVDEFKAARPEQMNEEQYAAWHERLARLELEVQNLHLTRAEKLRQVNQVAMLRLAKRHLGSSKVAKAHEEGVRLSQLSTRVRVANQEVTPQAAAERPAESSRLVTGGEYRTMPGEPKHLKAARKQVEILGGRFEKAHGRREEAIQRELVRQGKRTAKLTEQQKIPRTVESARARLSVLERAHARIVNRQVERRRSENVGVDEGARLLQEHDQQIHAAELRLHAAKQAVEEHPPAQRSFSHAGGAKGRKATPEELALVKARRELAALQRGRRRFADAARTGWLRNPVDQRYIARMNRKAPGLTKHEAEQNRAMIERDLRQTAEQNAHHPSSKAYLEHLAEMDRLRAGLSQLDEKYLFAKERPTARERAQHLGFEPQAGRVDPELVKLNKKIAALQKRGASQERLAPLLDERDHLVAEGKIGLPYRVGNTVVGPLGEHLQPHEATVGRIGGALSIAQDRLQGIERKFANQHGYVPEEGQHTRTQLVGGVPTGEEAYISGQRKVGSRERAAAKARNILGKAPRQGYQYQSKGKLFLEARARRGSKVVLSDWLRTAHSLHRRRDVQIAAGFTKPLDPEQPHLGLLKGHKIFDPEGLLSPKTRRHLMEKQGMSRLEAMTPQELDREAKLDYENEIKRVFLDPAALEGTPEVIQAIKDGKIKQIPDKIANAFAAGDRLPFAGITETEAPIARAAVELLDLSNNITRLGVLWLKGSFVPMNLGGNVIFHTIEAGPHAPVSLGRAFAGTIASSPWMPGRLSQALHVLAQVSPENLRLIDFEVGSGAATSIAGEGVGPLGRVTRAIGHVSNVLADIGPRRAAWLYEAWKRGYRTDAQITRLLKDPKLKPVKNQVGETAERAMVQFRGLGPTERRVITRAIFIYPWMKGATKYFARYYIDRPVQASITTRIGQEGYDHVAEQVGKLVSFLQGIVPVGKVQHKLGVDVIPVRGTASLTPFGTGVQVLNTLYSLGSGKAAPTTYRLFSFVQPSVQALLSAATGVNLRTGSEYPGDQGFLEDVTGFMQGQYALERVLSTFTSSPQSKPFTGSPAKQRLYVGEGGWKAALSEMFLGSFRVRELNLGAQAAKQHAEARASMSKMERAHDDADQLRKHLLEGAAKTRIPLASKGKLLPWVEDTVAAYESRKLNRLKWAQSNGVSGTLTRAQNAQADIQLLARTGRLSPEGAANLTKAVKRYEGMVGRFGVKPAGAWAENQLSGMLKTFGKMAFYAPQLSYLRRVLATKGYRLDVP